MTLSSPTIGKIAREVFIGQDPIRLADNERDEWQQRIANRLQGLRGVEVENSSTRRDSANTQYICEIALQDLSGKSGYYYRNSFDVIHSEEGELVLRHGGRKGSRSPLSDLDELVTFIERCEVMLERQELQRKKRQKVRSLQSHAIVAQVKQLAQEEKFDFCYVADTVKLVLRVQLSEKEGIELQIPFTKFEAILPNLRDIIRSARDLHAQGIKFKMQNISNMYGTWFRHEA